MKKNTNLAMCPFERVAFHYFNRIADQKVLSVFSDEHTEILYLFKFTSDLKVCTK